jgi:flagellar hook-basal body complex protein FliE
VIDKIVGSPIRSLYDMQSKGILGIDDSQNVSFMDMLRDSLQKVNQSQLQSDQAIQSFLRGETSDVHTVMIEMEKADLNFRYAMQVRNKVIQAYEEIMRMQI